MRKYKRLTLTFATGFTGGFLTCICITKYLTRPDNPGGEILVIPLVFALLYLIEELRGGFKLYDKTIKENEKEIKLYDETLQTYRSRDYQG